MRGPPLRSKKRWARFCAFFLEMPSSSKSSQVMSLPARRFLRSRRVSFLAGSDRDTNIPRLLRGTYQSPILVQWQPAVKQERHIDIVVVQFS